jgi:hypothetical protein
VVFLDIGTIFGSTGGESGNTVDKCLSITAVSSHTVLKVKGTESRDFRPSGFFRQTIRFQ